MKKLKYLSIVPLLAIVATTSSCSMPLVGTSSDTENVKSAIEKVRKLAHDLETISYSYVVNSTRDLIGYISLKHVVNAIDIVTNINEISIGRYPFTINKNPVNIDVIPSK